VRIYDIAKNQMPVDAYTSCNDMMNNMSVIDGDGDLPGSKGQK